MGSKVPHPNLKRKIPLGAEEGGNMTDKETENWTFQHLGVIVADMDKAVEYYRSLGIVDFPPESPGAATSPTWQEFTTYGETVIKDGQLLVPLKPGAKPGGLRFCWVGSMTLELIQPPEGVFKTLHNDFLDNFGEGIDHIAYGVTPENFEQEVEKMKAKGLPIIMSGEQSNGGGFVYFDTRKVGGIVIELMKVRSR